MRNEFHYRCLPGYFICRVAVPVVPTILKVGEFVSQAENGMCRRHLSSTSAACKVIQFTSEAPIKKRAFGGAVSHDQHDHDPPIVLFDTASILFGTSATSTLPFQPS